jgi:3-oxoisoapionate kinase
MKRLLLTFYGDDFTGSTDAMEQLTLAGIRTVLFIEPPTPRQLAAFKDLQAVGVAGRTRSMTPDAMERELKPALIKLKALGARHVHYKVCSTFDSSPKVGSIGRVMDVAAKIFRAPFIPLLVAAPALGRFTVFGNHFASYGIGSSGGIHRLDRHPSISKHPVTPMTEADLRVHLARQTRKRIGLFDIVNVALPPKDARAALQQLLAEKPEVVLFDALDPGQLALIGGLIDEYANPERPLFSVGSSGIESALGEHWSRKRPSKADVQPVKQIVVGSGSCSPVTSAQIAWALKVGFAEVKINARALADRAGLPTEMARATHCVIKLLFEKRSVVVHTADQGADRRVTARLKHRTADVLGTALGKVLRDVLSAHSVQRVCLAGGDTSSFAARALGIEALEMIAPLTPGAPLCKAFAPGSPIHQREVVFKGGQVGGENYFEIVKNGKA